MRTVLKVTPSLHPTFAFELLNENANEPIPKHTVGKDAVIVLFYILVMILKERTWPTAS